jgi:probable rRNA maturation factor
VEVSVVFCDDDFIRTLNRRYRGQDCPTDVLSFPQGQDAGALGDIVIAVPYTQRQAAARGVPLGAELEWLFLHGCLHLLGYDDQTDAGADSMRRRARRVLAVLGERSPADADPV